MCQTAHNSYHRTAAKNVACFFNGQISLFAEEVSLTPYLRSLYNLLRSPNTRLLYNLYCATQMLRCAVLASHRTTVYCLVAAFRAPCLLAARDGYATVSTQQTRRMQNLSNKAYRCRQYDLRNVVLGQCCVRPTENTHSLILFRYFYFFLPL